MMNGQFNKAYDDTNDAGDNDDGIDLKAFSPQYGSTDFVDQPTKTKTDHGSSDEQERQKWGSPVEFLLSCIAMSVCIDMIGLLFSFDLVLAFKIRKECPLCNQ